MGTRARRLTTTGVGLVALVATLWAVPATAAGGPSDRAREVAAHWTSARMDAAVPRDLFLDDQGHGYVRSADGRLVRSSGQPAPHAKPPDTPGGGNGGGNSGGEDGGATDNTTVAGWDPASGATIAGTHTFRATVTDPEGVKSVQFELTPSSGGTTQTFNAASAGGDEWTVTLQFGGDGAWSWRVIGKDGAKRGGNAFTSAPQAFTVDTSDGGGGTPDPGVVTNARWTAGGDVQTAAGRIYFEMPTNGRRWGGYVCSGTVATDGVSGRSVIVTAAHCVYDDVTSVFARNVLFIPSQDDGGTDGTDRECSNDPEGCWVPSMGVVDANWANHTWPENIPWDYAYYVVPDSGAHVSSGGTADGGTHPLDGTVGSLAQDFDPPVTGEVTHALGYSYNDDPHFMYCAEAMATEGADNWWLPSCELSGGSSGGPWIQPMDTAAGSGPIISVNSWGYRDQPGMAGPKLSGTSATCVFDLATTAALTPTSRGHLWSGSC